MNELIINNYCRKAVYGIHQPMNEGANCGKAEPLPNELPQIQNEIEWRKRSTAISVDTLLATANATARPNIAENIKSFFSFTCIFRSMAQNWYQIESKSRNMHKNRNIIIFLSALSCSRSLSHLLSTDLCVCVFLFSIFLCFALLCFFTFVDFAGMSLWQTDVSSLQMNVIYEHRTQCERWMRRVAARQQHSHTHSTHTHFGVKSRSRTSVV